MGGEAPELGVQVRALSQDELKQQAAWKAVEYVSSGMVLGLGTGSTAAYAVCTPSCSQYWKQGAMGVFCIARSLMGAKNWDGVLS